MHGLEIDHVGGWNERGFETGFFKNLDRQLPAQGFPGVEIVADDSYFWGVTTAMQADADFREAVDIVGQHYPCGIGYSASIDCSSPEEARALGKPLWASEQWWNNHGTREGAGLLARQINQAYVDGKMTATIIWPLLSAMSEQLPNPDTGLIAAGRPWSGQFKTGPSLWAMAHTGQFVEHGWRYMDSAPTTLANGGTIVSMRNPQSGDWSAIPETDQARGPQTLRLKIADGLSSGTVAMWRTDLRSKDPARWFERLADQAADSAGEIALTLEPGHVYSLTTTSGQGKGDTASPSQAPFALPYTEDFEATERGHSPRYFTDIEGAFEAVPCAGGRPGQCVRQQIERHPVPWFAPPAPWVTHPRTIVGDPLWWGDYEVATDVLFERPTVAEIGGRLGRQIINNFELTGYWARVAATGAWKIYRQDWQGAVHTLAAGSVLPLGIDTWHRIALRFEGERIALAIDGQEVGSVDDGTFRVGSTGLGVTTLSHVQFDDLAVTPTAPVPRLLAPSETTASAAAVVDDNLGTVWSDRAGGSVTLDLGAPIDVAALVYQPRAEQSPSGIVQSYRVEVSEDGSDWQQVAAGDWTFDLSPKAAVWEPRPARYVRFTGTRGSDGRVAASELRVATC